MGKPRLSQEKVLEIVRLRQTGHSLPEIKRMTGSGNSTVSKYIRDVKVLPEFIQILKEKQGGSIVRAHRKWELAKLNAEKLIGVLSDRDRLLVLAALYWGEGTKRELNLINGNPLLVRVFLRSLYKLGVRKDDVRINVRVYGAQNLNKTKKFWLRYLDLAPRHYVGCEILEGSKREKLKHGMCRIRVRKAQQSFKLIMSMIDLLGQKI